MPARLLTAALLLAVASACHVNQAPSDLDGIEHWTWDNYVSGTDAEVADAVNKFNALSTLSDVKGSGNFQGTLPTDLTAMELGVISLMQPNNPSTAPGLITITEMPCTLDQIEPLLYCLDQAKIHSGTYTTYTRTYDSSLADYMSRKSETITWTTNMSISDVGNTYSDTVTGGLRRIPAQSSSVTPFGPILLSRTWLPKPATFTTSGGTFNQDYQIEIYYERTPGHVVHSFVDWRDIKVSFLGSEVTSSDSTYQSIILSNDVNWDSSTAMECAGALPVNMGQCTGSSG